MWLLNFLEYSHLSTFFKSLQLVLRAIVKIPNFGKELLRSRLSIMQNLYALTAVLRKMLSLHLKSFLVDFLTLSISEWNLVKITSFGKELLKSSLSIMQKLDALTVVLPEILTFKLKSFGVDVLTLSISEWKLAKIPNIGKELLRSSLSIT